MDATAKRGSVALPVRALFFVAVAAAWLGGCYGFGAYSQPQPDTPEAPLDQAGRGEKLFAQGCAGCHGEQGEGSEGRPALIGEKALPVSPPADAQARKTEFNTAKDIFDFIKSDMPPIAPGSMSDEETWAIVAFQLKASGVTTKGNVGPANAACIKLHP